ncbi:flagella basal body P-ring formation protein FlgA [Kitasatospora sp. NPDC059577]|uniref:flagella basal body P-ring formation protein FlgA n=1 Tax=unclassified Kitasatospora TaxID=2633591 RepID=UPI00367B1BF2
MSSTVTGSHGAGAPAGPSAVAPAAPPRALTARRRRPALIGLSVALVAAGGLLGAFAVLTTGQHKAVVALAKPVAEGAVITDADLTEASITLDPAAIKPILAVDRSTVVGKRAANSLHAGALVTKEDLTDAPLIAAGQQLVGVLLKPGQLPSTPLTPGLAVLVVSTPGEDSAAGAAANAANAAPPATMKAKVVRVGDPETTGSRTVDLAVAGTDGPALAARAATGRIALIVAAKGTG